MRHVAFCLLLLAAPAFAEEAENPSGRELMSEALQLFMQGLMTEVEPAMEGLSELLDNIDGYHRPEILPNGDIIIRRKRADDPISDEIEI
ncbi:MAG: hypothetical protein OXQ92_03770 [Boseongicola sp.]|nr:hypothetical protein [Boseongicola sp.]MDD9976774.1 hypothetical protein [Boseongicola sp.]